MTECLKKSFLEMWHINNDFNGSLALWYADSRLETCDQCGNDKDEDYTHANYNSIVKQLKPIKSFLSVKICLLRSVLKKNQSLINKNCLFESIKRCCSYINVEFVI